MMVFWGSNFLRALDALVSQSPCCQRIAIKLAGVSCIYFGELILTRNPDFHWVNLGEWKVNILMLSHLFLSETISYYEKDELLLARKLEACDVSQIQRDPVINRYKSLVYKWM
jgi:hypothetical protein